MTAANTTQRWIDYTHYPKALLSNIPQYPIKMGAFYIMDPRATEAANVLMRQGVEVYKLTKDVTLPSASTFKFYGPNRNENWGITKNRTGYIGVLTTKMPRPRTEVLDNYSTEANKISLNFQDTVAGVPWVPLTTAQTPTEADAPSSGGGDWFSMSSNLVAKAGYYVIPTAQKWGRYAGFQLEPRSNCGLLFWAHWDSAVGGHASGNVATIVDNFNLDLVKTFDYSAIPTSALKRLLYYEDSPDPKLIDPNDLPPIPSKVPTAKDIAGFNPKNSPVVGFKMNDDESIITATILDDKDEIYNGMTLVFYFYDPKGKLITALTQAWDGEKDGTYEVQFSYDDLLKNGLKPGNEYPFAFADVIVDVATGKLVVGNNYVSWGAAFPFGAKEEECLIGCNAVSYAMFALLAIVPFIVRKKKK
jgi:hypothetical protein